MDSSLIEKDRTWKDISWNIDGDDKWLSDVDHIVLEENCEQGVPDGHVRFRLVGSGTWWKSITVHTDDQFLYELVAVQEQDAPGIIKYADVPYTNLALYSYVLSKAKFLGIHTDIYKIANVNEMQPGCTYTFKWLQD